MFLDERDGCCFSLMWFLLYHYRLRLNQVLHHGENLGVAPRVNLQRSLGTCQNQ